MNDLVLQLVGKVNALSLRERALVSCAVLAILFTLWNELLMMPMERENKQIANETEAVQQRVISLNDQIKTLLEKARKDPERLMRSDLERYGYELSELDQQISALAENLISPQKMTHVLQEMLTQISGLKVIGVKSLIAQPLLESSVRKTGAQRDNSGSKIAAPVLGIYRHRLIIEFEAEFEQTVEYLKALEALPWQIFWDSIDYTVEEHPKAHVTIGVSTLSLHEGWIGV